MKDNSKQRKKMVSSSTTNEIFLKNSKHISEQNEQIFSKLKMFD